MIFFEDIVVGEPIEIGTHQFTVEEIERFGTAFDPAPRFLDASPDPRPLASGWLIGANFIRLWLRYVAARSAEGVARGEALAQPGPSPGMRDVVWAMPVHAGDVLTYRTECVEKRLSRSRPGWGLVTSRITATNQHGGCVYAMTGTAFFQTRAE